MPSMIASREIYYDGRTIMPGERFEAREQHVRILAAIKKATVAPSEPVPEPAPRAMRGRRAALPPDPQPVPEPTVPEPTAPEAAPEPATADPLLLPGRYARRDLRPLDDASPG
jgi:hypothetical protein